MKAPANINHLWASLLVEELVRHGTTLFVVCPGSRSTPLAVAVAQNSKAEALIHWDERAAGFVALGWGRATGRPAAVVTTSGTAVANLLPAAVEADADGVPLLLLTADRPPEVRETGANQTVRQPPIFRDVARWALDWPVPTTDVPARWVLSTAAHAAQRALEPPGPVHLNLPFREPLGAQPDGLDLEGALEGLDGWLGHDLEGDEHWMNADGDRTVRSAPYTARRDSPSAVSDRSDDLAHRLAVTKRGLVVVGALSEPGAFARALEAETLGRVLGWPVAADVRSSIRLTSSGDAAAHYADLALASEAARDRLRPDAVVHIGGRITSKRLTALLSASKPDLYVRVGNRPARVDPDALVTDHIEGALWPAVARLVAAAERIAGPPSDGGAPSAWQAAWLAASRAAGRVAANLGDLGEPAIARAVSGAGLPVVVAASMPVRDLDAFGAVSPEPVPVFANRGASGIDGTVATAHGVARGLGGPVALLIGDLALLHDQTSLALLRDGPPVIVVVVNNDGGGIFHRLPIADGAGALEAETFERFFGTPHRLGFEHAARQVGLPYHAPSSLEAFARVLEGAVQSGVSALIEVRTDRDEQAALRRALEAEVAAAVDAALV